MDGIGLKVVGGAASEVARPEPTPAAGGFGDALGQAIQGVDKLQVQADQAAEKNALGAGNLHEMALALEKADVAMRLATKVRNKLVDAYQEVMRMTI